MDAIQLPFISTFLGSKEDDKHSLNADGSFNPTDEFNKRVEKYNSKFIKAVLSPLVKGLDNANFIVIFRQRTLDETEFDAEIWVDTKEAYNKMTNIIGENISDKKLHYYSRGSIQHYLDKH